MSVYQILCNPNDEFKRWVNHEGKLMSLKLAKHKLELVNKEVYPNAIIEIDCSVLKFHSSWDWLMPIVQKIEGLKNHYIEIVEDSAYVYDVSKFDDNQTDPVIITKGDTKIDAVYKAVVEFIKWYNSK